MNRITVAVIALSVAVVLGVQERAATQGSELANSHVSHIGVVVPDMDAALRE